MYHVANPREKALDFQLSELNADGASSGAVNSSKTVIDKKNNWRLEALAKKAH